MGGGMACNLIKKGNSVLAFDVVDSNIQAVVAQACIISDRFSLKVFWPCYCCFNSEPKCHCLYFYLLLSSVLIFLSPYNLILI